MKTMNLFFRIAGGILRAVVIMTASILLVYGAYVILDTLNVERNAFVSSSLLKYKPTANADSGEEYNMYELKAINEDLVAWLEIEGTNIDYPVVQGEDEIEYASKDVFGNSSITGSIYLSSGNDRTFDDFYNVIYGHNMDAGAMFGDIAKYTNKGYFNSHRKGTLYTDGKSYDFTIYAVLKTNAYENSIYTTNVEKKEDAGQAVDFINENMIHGEIKNLDDLNKILVFSTCEMADTDGRVVVVADAVLSDKLYGTNNVIDSGTKGIRKNISSHKVDNWSLINLFCLAGSLFTLLPLAASIKKYKMFSYSKNVREQVENNYNQIIPYLSEEEAGEEFQTKLLKAVRFFRKKIKAALIIEIAALAGSAFIFFYFEDISKRVAFIDEYTPFMIVLFGLSLTADIACYTYRGPEIPELIDDFIMNGENAVTAEGK